MTRRPGSLCTRAASMCLGLLAGLWLLGFTALAGAQSLSVRPEAPDLTERLNREAKVLSLPVDAQGADIIATAQGDYARLLAVLYEEGYFGASISIQLAGREAADISALSNTSNVRPVAIAVDLGQPFTFGRVAVSPLPAETRLPDGFVSGARARTDVIREGASASIDAWRQASHATAEIVDQQIVARHPAAKLDVDLKIAPGPALRFGAFRVPENSEVRAARLRAIGGLPEGEPFDPDTLETVRKRLVRTGTFNSVVLREARLPNPDGTLDIILDVETAPRRRIGLGAEVSTQSGLSFEAFWLNRNTFGGAEQLRFDFDIDGIAGETGGIDLSLGGRFSIPGFRRPDDTYEVFGTLAQLDEVAFDSDVFEFGVRRERHVKDGEVIVGLGGAFRYSKTRDALGERRFHHAVIDWDATLEQRDDPLNPTEGRYVFLSVRPFLGLGDDSGTGVRFAGDLRAYRAIGTGSVLAGRLQFGSVIGADLIEVPPEYLFFSGGGGSVRGQSFQSLGVETANGTVGGRGFLGASVELRQDVSDTLSVVGFLDVGYVSESATFEDGSEHAGAGVGLRYKTTLGPIRADIGFPIGGDSTDDFGIFVGIGQAF